MRPSVCFSILVLAVALAKASPAVKPAEKKSSVEDAKLESEKEDLKIEDTGSDKDRAKKSASFSVAIKPAGFLQTVQAPCKGSQQVVPSSNIAVQSEPVAQSVQSYNIVQPSYVQSSYVQPSYVQPSYVQSSYVQPSYVQPSYVQPSYVQSMPQASIALPQQIGGPIQSLQVVTSSSKPCAESVPSVPQTETVPQVSVEKTNSNSDSEEVPKEQLKPERIELAPEPLPVPQETLAILPAAPSYHEHLYALPSSSMVMYPELQPMGLASLLQGSSTPLPVHQCPCQNNIAKFSEAAIEPMAVKVFPYSSTVARSPIVMPHNARMHIVTHVSNNNCSFSAQLWNLLLTDLYFQDHGMGVRPRHSHSHIHAHVDVNAAKPQSFVVPASQYSTPGLVDVSATSGISLNPMTYRVASPILAGSLGNSENYNNSPLAFEVNDLMQSNKVPREVNSSAKMEEVKQQADDNRKSIKEETKQN
ncbi:uncharacterized protein LOC143218964 [Lasioglossum baleicum]|uniref:uncharacterized protein LOC143218964 n=1 Tax=Lasioglossum baleicum TaxID=434251 RepID=UPI003FCECEF3